MVTELEGEVKKKNQIKNNAHKALINIESNVLEISNNTKYNAVNEELEQKDNEMSCANNVNTISIKCQQRK